jgi:peroxiredoxin
MALLQNHSTFPSLEVPRVGGGTLRLPEDLAGSFGVVLFYRGAWCPYCNTQLSAFGRAHEALHEAGIEVAALSVDEEQASAELVAKRGLPFAVGHSADADELATATGAYVNDEPHHLQSTGFVLDADGRVVTAVYSSGAIGRLMPDDVLGLVRYITQHA